MLKLIIWFIIGFILLIALIGFLEKGIEKQEKVECLHW